MSEATEHRSEDDLSHRLLELCVCEGRFPPCIYCEARDRIDVQDRCLRLSQAEMSKMRRRIANLHELVRT